MFMYVCMVSSKHAAQATTLNEGQCHLDAKFLNPAWWPARSKVRVSGFDQVDRINFYFKKIQNGVILVKKTKVNGLQPGF